MNSAQKFCNIFIFIIVSVMLLCLSSQGRAEELIRSTSLRQEITTSNNSERIDYVDENGAITFASDLGYSTMIRTWEDDYEVDEYFDPTGNPIMLRMGYYAVKREYDEFGRNWRVTYLGSNHEPIIWGNGYSMAVRTFDENGNIEIERYLDKQGNPIKTNSYGYGCYKEYDTNNRNNVLIYLDSNDKPLVTGQGFAIVRRVYYEEGYSEGQVKEEFYFNSNDEPIMLMYGQSGLHKEYDQFGRIAALTYLDANGDPIITTAGYTTIKRTYYDDDSIESEMYFDIDGEPVSLSDGQYGIRYKDGKKTYLNKNGQEQINLKQILYNNDWVVIFIVVCIIFVSFFTGRKMNILFLAVYFAAIIYMTLMHRIKIAEDYYDILLETNGGQTLNNILSKGVISNFLLFVPLGMLLYRIYPKIRILIVPVLVSITIEILQYTLKIGLFELYDLISNALGSFAGYFIGSGLTKLIDMKKKHVTSYGK